MYMLGLTEHNPMKAWISPVMFILAYMFTWDRSWEGEWFIYYFFFLTLLVMSYVYWDGLTTRVHRANASTCSSRQRRCEPVLEPYLFIFLLFLFWLIPTVTRSVQQPAGTPQFVVITGDVLKTINRAFLVQKQHRTSSFRLF